MSSLSPPPRTTDEMIANSSEREGERGTSQFVSTSTRYGCSADFGMNSEFRRVFCKLCPCLRVLSEFDLCVRAADWHARDTFDRGLRLLLWLCTNIYPSMYTINNLFDCASPSGLRRRTPKEPSRAACRRLPSSFKHLEKKYIHPSRSRSRSETKHILILSVPAYRCQCTVLLSSNRCLAFVIVIVFEARCSSALRLCNVVKGNLVGFPGGPEGGNGDSEPSTYSGCDVLPP